MANPEFTPEQLNEAKSKVTALFMGDQMEKVLGRFQGEETRDRLWNEAANTHRPFTERISGLRRSFKVVAETQNTYGPPFQDIAKLPFMRVEDIMAKEFLGDVLFSRMTQSPGYLDYGIEMLDEAQAMAIELGFEQGWRAEPGTKITLDQAVEATLVGRLRFQYQNPKSPQ